MRRRLFTARLFAPRRVRLFPTPTPIRDWRAASRGQVYRLLHGDNRQRLKELPDNSIDAVICDPPYGLGDPPTPKQLVHILTAWLAGEDSPNKGRGYMGKAWDAFVPGPSVWRECLRVLKPGGHLLAFFGTRTLDIGGLAIRLAGFEIRDTLAWLYGSGMIHSRNLAADIGKIEPGRAEEFEGLGTGVKPCYEPIVLARKPVEGTIAANVLRYGTGGLGVGACKLSRGSSPGNLIHDGSPEIIDLFPSTKPRRPQVRDGAPMDAGGNWNYKRPDSLIDDLGGSAARYFYCAKADKRDRDAGLEHWPEASAGLRAGGRAEGSAGLDNPRAGTRSPAKNTHPTVKPTALMTWLIKLVLPMGGVALDPFAGSGSTGRAAAFAGCGFIGCELNAEYIELACARIKEALDKDPCPAET